MKSQLSWATGFLPTGGGIEQRRLDFLRLLRQAPAITEVTYADGDGREQIKVSRLAMDTLASGIDLVGTQIRSCKGQQALHRSRFSARSRSPISRWHSRALAVAPA